MTDDGDEPERVKLAHSLENETPKHHKDTCLFGEFKNSNGDCVCYEEGTNLIGETFAKADDVETYRECQKLCASQNNCEYWSHYTGGENSNSCLLKNKISTISRESDNPESGHFVSGTKNCNVPITTGIYESRKINLLKNMNNVNLYILDSIY